MKLYCIVDVKAKAVCATFQSVSDSAAERSFLSLLAGEKSLFSDFPEDFALYPLAELSFDSRLTVSAHDAEYLRKAGFNVLSYQVDDPLKRGVDYDRAWLKLKHDEWFPAPIESEGDKNDGK